MNQEQQPESSAAAGRHARHGDRRVRNLIAPPPFSTRDGQVATDRRSHLDRRAAWIRNFFIDQAESPQG